MKGTKALAAVAMLAGVCLAADKPGEDKLPLAPVDAPQVREDAAQAADRAKLEQAKAQAEAAKAQAEQARVQFDVRVDQAIFDQLNGQIILQPPAPALVKSTYLGTALGTLDDQQRKTLGLRPGIGLRIQQPEPGSPAEAAGVKPGDILEKIDDQLAINLEQVVALIRSMNADDQVTLTVIRDGKREQIKVKLGQKELPAPGATLATRVRQTPAINLVPPGFVPMQDGIIHLDQGAIAQDGLVVRLLDNAATHKLPGKLDAMTWSDDDMTLVLTVKATPNGRQVHIVAEEPDGKVLYDGGITTGEEREALPENLKQKLKLPGLSELIEKMKE
jgi:membrane-associated protease RseP (regulator of RpoE activity)